MTPLPPIADPDTIYAFDLSCWMWRFYSTVKGAAAFEFIEFMRRILRERVPGGVTACIDLPYPTLRHDMAPKVYKAQRPDKDIMLVERIRWAQELCQDVFGVTPVGVRGYEADDILAALVKQARAAGKRVVVLAHDKDLLQLVDGTSCVMWDGKQQVWGPEEVQKKFSVHPCQLRDYLAIVGDTADNVPGVKGLGPKAAVELLKAHSTLEAALAQVIALPVRDRSTAQRKLLEDSHNALLSQKLIALMDDAPYTFDWERLSRWAS